MPDYPIVSADDHIDMQWLPADIFEKRVPASVRDRMPKVEKTERGAVWTADGRVVAPHGPRWGTSTMMAGMKSGLERGGVLREGEFRPTTPELRLEDMARDGVSASVLYGPINPLFFGDPEVRKAGVRAYNEWLAEFCSAAPDKFLGVGLLPYDNAQEAADEIYHLADLKIREGMFLAARVEAPVHDEYWEPLWKAAEETGTIIGFHLSGGLRTVPDRALAKGLGPNGVAVSVIPLQMDEPLCGVVFGGVLERHPGLKIVLAETGIGWIPYVLERMEHVLDRFKGNPEYWDARGGIGLSLRPREYFRRQVWATFQEDQVGLKCLDDLGADRVMWASDYPHPDGTWPNSQQAIEEQFGHLDETTRRKILSDNARTLYGI
ncbi:MAG TPA: amidohydrolase family protein [Dehalococcoidia bacterium]|nr:amidohydrolase family protein [Dehalococcoidia bacterium]